MTNEQLATTEVNEEYKSGIRQCRNCGSPLEKINGCNWTQCTSCQRACCFLCGAQMASDNRNVTPHDCKPNNFISWQINRRTRRETTQHRGPNQVNLFVTTHTGTTITLVVGLNDTVDKLKQIVSQKTGIPDYSQLLTYSGKQLANGFKVCQYNIRNQSTLQLVTRVNGG
jgi:hypothetical protein